MIRLLFILLFATGLLTACDIGGLQNEIADLRQQLEEATAPEAIAKLQKELIAKQKKLLKEESEKQEGLFTAIEKTENKEDCDKLMEQIQDSQNRIEMLATEYAVGVAFHRGGIGTCTETGYNDGKDAPPSSG